MERNILAREISNLRFSETPLVTLPMNVPSTVSYMMNMISQFNTEFPINDLPINIVGRHYSQYRFDGSPRSNMATFRATRTNKDGTKRSHAARDIYTKPLTPVVAISGGKVISVSYFYSKTWEVTVEHDFSLDGINKAIVRYGELDPKSINFKENDIIQKGNIIGKTGKLLDGKVSTMKKYETKGVEIYMLHFELYSGTLGADLKSNPLTIRSEKPFERRADLIDPLPLLSLSFKKKFGFELAEYPQYLEYKTKLTNLGKGIKEKMLDFSRSNLEMLNSNIVNEININWQFINQLENNSNTLTADVPDPEGSNSGVTVAAGFDIGQCDEGDLRKMNFSEKLIQKFKPYLGLTQKKAVKKLTEIPLILTKWEALEVNFKMFTFKLLTLEKQYKTKAKKSFFDLPIEAQTVIFSVFHQYGSLNKVPTFFKYVAGEDWKNAVKELRNFHDSYPTRRRKEANYLEKLV